MIKINGILPGHFHYIRTLIVLGLVTVLLFLFPSVRFFCFFNLTPLIILSLPFLILRRKLGTKGRFLCLGLIMVIAFFIHIRHYALFGTYAGWDSREFIAYAEAFVNGKGLSDVIYRPPLYPLFVSIIFSLTRNPIEWIVIIQQFLMLLCIPLIFYFALFCGFKEDTALLASLFFATNAMVIRLAQFIMSEILSLTLLLSAIVLFFQFLKRRSFLWALLTGIAFSAATHCRQLAAPVFFFMVLMAILQLRIKKWKEILIVIASFVICNIPWSLHNYSQHGHFGLSSHLGANIFTKLSSYRLEKKNGKYFNIIREPYQHVLEDLSLTGFTVPSRPEDRWDINRIPHVLSDTLIKYHGFTYSQVSNLLTRISVEGFCAHPLRYLYSVGKTLWTLVNYHIELYPKITRIIPVTSSQQLSKSLRPFLQGIVYISGLAVFAFLIVIFCRKEVTVMYLFPLEVLLTGYLTTAAIQVGFTRYTVPWAPYLCICGAFLVTSIVEILEHAGVFVYKNIEVLIKQSRPSRD